jgi:uracil phosphoribosyltransferase
MDTTPALPTVRVVSHPLIQHKITILRDRATPTKIFKELVDEIAMLMAYEATSDLTLEAVEVDTPLERTTGRRMSGKKLTLVPILRAGLGMVEGIYRLVPGARVGHIGLYRNHDTLDTTRWSRWTTTSRCRATLPSVTSFFWTRCSPREGARWQR